MRLRFTRLGWWNAVDAEDILVGRLWTAVVFDISDCPWTGDFEMAMVMLTAV
jgi:hypothetical protein